MFIFPLKAIAAPSIVQIDKQQQLKQTNEHFFFPQRRNNKIFWCIGFQPEECRQALNACQGQLDEAALWLTQNCQLSSAAQAASAATGSALDTAETVQGGYFLEGSKISFTNFECKISTINITVIDDCLNADVPLINAEGMYDFILSQLISSCH